MAHSARGARRASGAQLVYAQLRDRILSLELAPGTRLYEPELSAALEVSRTPLREALRLLLAEDLLDQLPTGGMVVRPMTAQDAAELYAVRAAIEELIATEAAERIDDAGVAHLAALLDRNERLVGIADEAMGAGADFHVAIAEIAENAWASRMLEQIEGHLSRYRRLTNETQQRRSEALAEHREILAALAERKPKVAGERAKAHVRAAREVAVAAIASQLSEPPAQGPGGHHRGSAAR